LVKKDSEHALKFKIKELEKTEDNKKKCKTVNCNFKININPDYLKTKDKKWHE